MLSCEHALAQRLAARRLRAGTTFAEMARQGDEALRQLLVVYISERRAERQAIGLELARLAPAATLVPMATRRDPEDTRTMDARREFKLRP
jgi:hypothetical protein